MNDSGMYNCTVASTAGRATRSVEILVQGKSVPANFRKCFKSHVKVHFTCKISILQILIFNEHETAWMMFQ